jgi:hypothetical protein
MVYFWYPTSGKSADAKGLYFPGTQRMDSLPEVRSRLAREFSKNWLEPYYTESQMAGTSTEHTAYFKKKEEQLQATRPGTYDVVLRATGLLHPAFSDIPLLFAGQDGYPPTDIVLHNLEVIEKYVREFLGKNLRQEKAPLLDSGSATIPEATVKQYGR